MFIHIKESTIHSTIYRKSQYNNHPSPRCLCWFVLLQFSGALNTCYFKSQLVLRSFSLQSICALNPLCFKSQVSLNQYFLTLRCHEVLFNWTFRRLYLFTWISRCLCKAFYLKSQMPFWNPSYFNSYVSLRTLPDAVDSDDMVARCFQILSTSILICIYILSL